MVAPTYLAEKVGLIFISNTRKPKGPHEADPSIEIGGLVIIYPSAVVAFVSAPTDVGMGFCRPRLVPKVSLRSCDIARAIVLVAVTHWASL